MTPRPHPLPAAALALLLFGCATNDETAGSGTLGDPSASSDVEGGRASPSGSTPSDGASGALGNDPSSGSPSGDTAGGSGGTAGEVPAVSGPASGGSAGSSPGDEGQEPPSGPAVNPSPVASGPADGDPAPTAPTDPGDASVPPEAPTPAAGGAAAEQSDASAPLPDSTGFLWPIDCVPDETCLSIGFPDVDDDGVAYDCGEPGYPGHEGTDIPITWEQMDEGVDVYAAAAGEVLFAFDGKYDRCPDDAEPDCAEAPEGSPGNSDGVQVCTELGPYCGDGSGGGSCYWCFWGGNVVVIRHTGLEGVFATRYDHLKNGSVLVRPGDVVSAGQKLAEVGSAGNSTGPHLHFEVWTTGFYELGEPWVGECGPNTTTSLWQFTPPWL